MYPTEKDLGGKRKREVDEYRIVKEEMQDGSILDDRQCMKLRKKSNVNSFLMHIPNEILGKILDEVSRKDLIRLSSTNHEHRGLVYMDLFRNIHLKWKDIKLFLENFKQLDYVQRVKILCDLENEKETNNGEWNVSFRKLFEECKNLREMHIELITSARCLKYKDDFDVELSNKVEKMTLVSKSVCNSGDVNDNAMFELTQLQRFHNIRQLTLKGFSIAKDIYFYPKIKEDMSDYRKRSLDGKLIELDEVKLINCAWEYPVNLKDVFSPEYPMPGNGSLLSSSTRNRRGDTNCRPVKIGLYFSGDYVKFTGCERFKSFINTEYNERFFFEIDFYKNLKELEVVVLNDRYKENGFTCYYPWLHMINLQREYYTEVAPDNGWSGHGAPVDSAMVKRSILSNLEKLVLVGWRSSSIQELDKCFAAKDGIEMHMRHFELYLMRGNNYERSGKPLLEEEVRKIDTYTQRLRSIFGPCCHVKVGYIDECMDERYDDTFGDVFRL
ncbi:hypothetical protein PICMEDRAFT_17686 [Pichia membranifaciens NRRL Y-2026]|uniref:F-box domain-containing protein n=1 Tax=Pichia membranifaciens NRRL Y-2026 TaxID=763406 RepID=A0A1E3NGD2_9ASCO|nr:hypothetical protein PICMEDRAFT_17686 [Pichia membranifaciens NRRL Y-2026]ODQ45197.1 hypothetical protein PICMEDRAFT_17686 [Pichia membranifaciens NRRL Y-2026]